MGSDVLLTCHATGETVSPCGFGKGRGSIGTLGGAFTRRKEMAASVSDAKREANGLRRLDQILGQLR